MFDALIFKTEMAKIPANWLENGADAEELWELYEMANIAIQGAYYQGLIDKKTMQETISAYVEAAAAAEKVRPAEIHPQVHYRRPL